MRRDYLELSCSEAQAEFGHWGAWRVLVALPAMTAGAAVMVVSLGFLGRWEGLGLLAWFAAGLLVLTRSGERVAVRLGCGFRRLSAAERAVLEPLWIMVLDRCGVPGESADLYVQPSRAINAYAVGTRSVALTSSVVADYRCGRLDADLLQAIIAHELGHHGTRGARFTLLTLWVTMPWRLFYRAIVRLSLRLAGGQPLVPLAIVVLAGFVVAIVQAVERQVWGTAMVLGAICVFFVVTPLADAALSRASERAADRYAARAGYSSELARALCVLDTRPAKPRRLLDRMLDSHPTPTRRIDDLAEGADLYRRVEFAAV